VVVRPAVAADADAIAALSALQRRRQSEWAPVWWRMADGADDLHPLWLGHLVSTEGPVARVAVDDEGAVRAAAIAHDQGAAWFVDDVVADAHDAGVAVLAAVAERPALTCVPTPDEAGAARAAAAGWTHRSSYWIGPPAPGPPPDLPSVAALPRPPHTFGPVLAEGRAGGVPAPPVYDPGGPVTLVAAVAGPDRAAAVAAERAAAADRGDVLVALVVGVDDPELAGVAEAAGLARTVDVWSAPDA